MFLNLFFIYVSVELEIFRLPRVKPRVKASQLFKNHCKAAMYAEKVSKMGFSSLHLEIIRKTPFGAFIGMQPFVVDGRLLDEIIRCYKGGD